MNHRALALMMAAAFLAGPAALVAAPPTYAAAPTAAQLPRGTEIYSADGKPVGKVVDVLESGTTGSAFAVVDVTTQLGEHRMVTVPTFHFNLEGGKVVSKLSYETIQHMPVFDYSAMGGGH
jgi:rRNA processing protein Gar1